MLISKTKRSHKPPPSLDQMIQKLILSTEIEFIEIALEISSNAWLWPKTDFFHWIAVLNRMDSLLESIVKKYGLPVQNQPLENQDVQKLIACLSLTRVLWDNATNRTLYNSYEHLCNLLYVNEVEVVFETIKFLTRPAVRVTSQKSLKSTFASINGVLQTLSDRWVSGTTSFDIVECYRAAQQTPAVTFQFYPSLDDEKPGDRKPSIDFNSPVVISQEPSGTTEGDAFLLWKQIVTDYQVPESHSFELLHKSRWCTLFSNVELRRKLLCIRLFSISILTNLNNEEATSKKIFLFEPDLILKLSQLLLLDYVECPDVQFAALNLLDSFCHYRGKLNEVMASIGASANHGYLISMLRKIIDTFEKNEHLYTPEFVDCFFSLVGYIISNQTSGNMVISAGIIPILVSTFKIKTTIHTKNIARCITMLDNILYGFNTSINIFTGIDGTDLLVERIHVEIENCLEIGSKLTRSQLLDVNDPGSSSPFKELFAKVSLMRASMKFILHLMQSYGSADGMRNLIDSKLPACLKTVFDHSLLFGHVGIFGLAVNIMSTFIHNEPTSLAILQEANIPDSFLKAANDQLPVSPEVVSAMPNAFGAICLNAAGLQSFLKANPFKNYFSVLKNDDHLRALVDTDVPQLVGNSVDEFIRHHPTTKEVVLLIIMETVAEVVEMAEKIEPNVSEGTGLFRNESFIFAEEFFERSKDKLVVDRTENKTTQLIEVITRFLEGLFQNISHCREFIKRSGIPLVFRLYNLKSLPYDFATAGQSASLSYLVRGLVEANVQETVTGLGNGFLEVCKSVESQLVKYGDQNNFFPTMTGVIQDQDIEKEVADEMFHSLVSILCYVRLLADLFCTHSMSHSKSINAIIQLFSSTNNNNLIRSLCKLLTISLKEKKGFFAQIPKEWTDEKAEPSNTQFLLKHFVESPEGLAVAKWNVLMVYHLIDELPADIMAFFSGVQKLLFSKKISDSVQRKGVLNILGQLSDVLLELLNSPAPPNMDEELFKSIFDFTKTMICDSKTGTGVAAAQLFFFKERNGLDIVFKKIESYLNMPLTEQVSEIIDSAFNFFAVISNEKSIIESTTLSILAQRQRDKTAADYFDPMKFLVELRQDILKYTLLLFNTDVFAKVSLACQKNVIAILTQIFEGEKPPKQESTVTSGRASANILSQILAQAVLPQVDSSRVEVLVEMGFPRAAAELALIRCGNSVSRAADYLINNPGVIDTAESTSRTATQSQPTAPDSTVQSSSNPPVENPTASVDTTGNEMEVEEPPVEKVPEGQTELEKLNELRTENSKLVLDRILVLLDHLDHSLMLNVKSLVVAICREETVNFSLTLLEKLVAIHRQVADNDANLKESLAVHMRLFATLLSDPAYQKKIMTTKGIQLQSFLGLLVETKAVESWLPSLMLILESYIMVSLEPGEVELLPFEERNQVVGHSIPFEALSLTIRTSIVKELVRILQFPDIDVDVLHCVLRTVAFLTRSYEVAQVFEESNGMAALFEPERIAKFLFQFPLTIMILRHCVESNQVLKFVMESAISTLLKVPRIKTIEMANFIKGTSHLICRDFDRFVECALLKCQLSNFDPKANQHYITWKPSEGDSDLIQYQAPPSKVVEYLVTQLMNTKYQARQPDAKKHDIHVRRCYLLQCLTEMVVSFPSIKIDVIAISQKRNVKSTPKPVAKNSFLNYIISELVPRNLHMHEGEHTPTPEEKNANQESIWAVAFISALATTGDKITEDSFNEKFQQIRVVVLDSMVRTLRDAIQSTTSRPEIRFGKIVSIAELCFKMLNHKIREGSTNDESQSLKIAQIMIEKGLANMLTNVISDLDILHPVSGKVTDALLKPLEKLSVSAKSLGKTEVNFSASSSKKKTPGGTPFDHAFRELEEEEMVQDESALSDIYRHSSLGMMDPASDNSLESATDDSGVEDYDEYTGEDEDMEGVESSTEDEMEIIVPQPYQGQEENEESSSSDDDDIEDDHEEGIIEIEMAGPEQDDWEDMSSESDQDMPDEGEHHFEDENNPFLEGSEGEEESEESDASDEFDHEVEDYFGMETGQSNRSNRIVTPADFFHSRMRERGSSWTTENRTNAFGNNLMDVTITGRPRSTVAETTHPLLAENAEPDVQNFNITDTRNVYEIYRELFGATDLFDERRSVPIGQAALAQLGSTQAKEKEKELSPAEKQLNILHGHKIMQSVERWQQEAKMIYNTKVNETATKVSNLILNALVPAAMTGIKKAEEERKAEQEKLEQERLEAQAKAKEEEEKQKAEEQSDNEMSIDAPEQPNEQTTSGGEPERQVIMIDGFPVDITGSGIDITFLEALPDELRHEVIQEHLRERTFVQQTIDADSIGLNPDFLNALPPDMREEVMAQEAENQRRISERAQGAAAAATTADPADPLVPKKVNQHKESANLLDIVGIASLLRLVFLPQAGEMVSLEKLLCNLCENSRSRSDILSLLLAVLINEPNNLSGVEKTFASVIGRPQFGSETSLVSSDQFPHLVSQRCLEILAHLSSEVPSIAKYFLTESELLIAPKTPKAGKKNKGKDKLVPNPQVYPIVTLLNLLEKELYLNNQSVLEELILLLAQLLRPLAHVAKKKFSGSESSTDQTPGKEKHDIKLPSIPASCVRAVVLALKDSVSTGKTFQSTLSVLQHLCAYPDNLEIVASELLNSSKELCTVNKANVQALFQQLLSMKKDETIDAEVLTSFTSPTASQAKLLRILKAIDYLFSKNHEHLLSANYLKKLPLRSELLVKSGTTGKEGPEKEKLHLEVLQDLFSRLEMDSMWKSLGSVMDLIDKSDDLIHVATVLLPLIESYMVVSKPLVSILKAQQPKEVPKLSSVKQHESNQSSFLTFAEAHKKVLNAMVRNNPSLMNGSFSLLVQNPKVLEFDNKRSYFNLQLHKGNLKGTFPPITINVRRNYVFEESYQQLQGKTGDYFKYGKLNVRFRDEEGVDAGGVTREWFSALALQMFNPDYALFKPSTADKVTYQPNRASGINPDHLFYFKFVGRIIGKAIYDNRLLDAYFTRSFYKCMISAPVDYKDMEATDLEFYKSLDWILHNDITDVLDLTFSIDVDDFGVSEIIDLIPDGRNIPVTEANKTEYVKLVTEQRLIASIQDQIKAFLDGFLEVIPKDLIKIFNEQELELLISGLPDIDIDDWKNNTDYQNYTPSSPQVQWFWRAVRSFTQEERAKLLQFTTGTSKVPLGGFAKLQGSTGIQIFQIHKEFSSPDRLPSAHTCFNQLDLPQYETYESLRSALLLAISECGTGFGFA